MQLATYSFCHRFFFHFFGKIIKNLKAILNSWALKKKNLRAQDRFDSQTAYQIWVDLIPALE